MQSQHTIEHTKLAIHSKTISDDQQTVAEQWARTFLYNRSDDTATQMTRLLAACVAKGDFKTKSYLANVLENPNDCLTIADYLSHGSRIIIDYAALNSENKKALLAFFDLKSPEIFSRSATHDVSRVRGEAHEGKGMLIGALGQLPAHAKEPRDFGINIAMGGEGQTNFAGDPIAADGYSGHFYFHRNDADNLLLCGLEQSAPAASLWEAAANIATTHADQFGQSHSLVGASDTYTAAGSLYLSDPHYQARLLIDKNVLPPAKYGSMQVTLNDRNWQTILSFTRELSTDKNQASLINKLKQTPQTAQKKHEPLTYIEFDFKSYLQRVYKLHVLPNNGMTDEIKRDITSWHLALLDIITQSTTPVAERLARLDRALQIADRPAGWISEEYERSIQQIRKLFQYESERHELKQHQANHRLFLISKSENLHAEMISLLSDCQETASFYQSSFIDKRDTVISQYLAGVNEKMDLLRSALGIEGLSESIVVLKSLADITEENIRTETNLIDTVKHHLNNHPELGSSTLYRKQLNNIERQALSQEKKSEARFNENNRLLNQRLQHAKEKHLQVIGKPPVY